MPPPRAYERYTRFFHVCAAVIGAGAVVQGAAGLVLIGLYGLVPAAAFGMIAVYLGLYPGLRLGWYTAGFEAAIEMLPKYRPEDGGGYAMFSSEPGADPHTRLVKISVHGVTCQALRDVDGRYTAEWIVTIPIPAGDRINQADVFVIRPP